MDTTLLARTLADSGEPAYRASQVWEWVARGVDSYEEMTNLPGILRDRLEAAVPLSTLTVETEARSDDGTVKTLFHTADGLPIEAVLTTPTTSALPGAGFGPRHANCAAMKKDALVTLVLAALLLVAISPAVEATKPAPIKVRTSDPFYPILEAFGEGGVEPGSVLNGCRLVPFAKCPGAELGGQETDRGDPARLEPAWAARERRRTGGVAVSLSDLRGADLRGANMATVLANGTNFRGADLRGTNLTYADLDRADLTGAELAGATFCNTIMPSGSVRNHRAHCPIPQPSLHGPTITIPPEAATAPSSPTRACRRPTSTMPTWHSATSPSPTCGAPSSDTPTWPAPACSQPTSPTPACSVPT